MIVIFKHFEDPSYRQHIVAYIGLDRGGDIGIGRRFLFDLLFPSESEAATFGTSYDVTVDVLRFGY